MEWFVELYGNTGIKIRVRRKIVDFRTRYQHVQVFDTYDFGKMLVLDGKIQLTERDEPFYHEMLVHVPMFSHRNPEKVLIVGGGDGGSLREVLKHGVEDVVVVELDEEVVRVAREHIGVDRGAFDDPRVTLLIEDGIEYVKNADERFDVMIVDGTDPNPYSEHIISEEFYRMCSRISDVFATQSQSPFVQTDYFSTMLENISKAMDVRVYINYVPTYPLGLWSYMLHSSEFPGLEVLRKRFEERGVETVHYNPELHIASFALPEWLKEVVERVKRT
ncbi:polyamine aminopropyltransferase [Geoglobus sp.]